jgi:hypothetical protein
MSEGFDASAFLNQTVDGPMSTVFPVCPEGEFTMKITDDGDIASWFSEAKWTDKNTGEARSAPTVTIPVEILDDAVRQKLGVQKVTSRLKMFLDMSGGKLDTSEGKNVRLGQLRAAVGQNTPGWNFSMLKGAGPFVGRTILVSDRNNPEIKYSEVSRVAKIS